MTESESRSAIVLEPAEEFIARYRRGARPSLEEYSKTHPESAAESHGGRRCSHHVSQSSVGADPHHNARNGLERNATARGCRKSSRNSPRNHGPNHGKDNA